MRSATSIGPVRQGGHLGQDHELVSSETPDGVAGAQHAERTGRPPRCRSLSPASWPSESLVSLKLSRSMKHRARADHGSAGTAAASARPGPRSAADWPDR